MPTARSALSVLPVVVAGAGAVVAALAAAPGVAAARPASTGFFSEAGIGAGGLIGASADHAKIGPAVALRLGWDLTTWFSVGIHAGATTHEATVPPPPEGEYLQLYQAQADARLGVRFDAIALFVEGGAGGSYMSSNILAKVGVLEPGEQYSLALSAGAGIEYQLLNRHYAFGLAGDWWLMPQFESLQGASGRLYLRYTY